MTEAEEAAVLSLLWEQGVLPRAMGYSAKLPTVRHCAQYGRVWADGQLLLVGGEPVR